jgi:CheY-like chemotaxis protein
MTAAGKLNTILIAEDDSDDRLLAEDALKECGVTADLRFVTDGVELMDYLQGKDKYKIPGGAPKPSLIILDLNMPRKDGREALREIKADAALKRIPVVILTTSTADSDVAGVYGLGANSFISKPVAFDRLVAIMKAIEEYWFEVVMLPYRA